MKKSFKIAKTIHETRIFRSWLVMTFKTLGCRLLKIKMIVNFFALK